MGTKWWVVLCALALTLHACSASQADEFPEEDEPLLEETEDEEQEPRERVRRQTSCSDLLDYCSQWPDKYCQDFKDYMKTNCPKKCGYCSGPTQQPSVCADKSQHCSGWKSSGFCHPSSQWNAYMKTNCPKTCDFCDDGGGGGGGGAESNKIKGCKFDSDTCDWHDIPFDDDFDFRVASGSVTGGPSSGQGGSGGYLVAEGGTQGQNAQLSLPLDVILDHNADHGNMCFRFYYYMNAGGSLELSEVKNQRGAPKTSIFSKSGNQGSQWNFAKVTVQGSVFRQLLFKATRGSGPIAIDNVSFADGSCA